MVQCDKEKALKTREIAMKKMEANDFVAARKIVLVAQKLYPELDRISHMLAVCDVHCAAEASVNREMDWYKIFRVEEAADESIIRKQYLKFSHSLHSDRNKSPGAEAAFKLVAEAYSVLHNPEKRYMYDLKTDRNVFGTKCPHCQKEHKCHLRILNMMIHCKQCRGNFMADPNIVRVNLASKETSKVPSAAVETSKR
ncbi:hypothetical protein BS78_07G062500, partial [Paspalum vaginatum]